MRYDSSNRLSNFEALRLLSMFLIVFYHLLIRFARVNPGFEELRVLWIPLHVGVVCFVLISGYFRIKPSSRGLLLLLSMLLVYSLPTIVSNIRQADSVSEVIHSLMFVSHTGYWFVKTYLALYLVSPLLNSFFDHAPIRLQWYLLAVLALVSIYFGHFAQDISLKEGKTLTNFMLIYMVGHMLKEYSPKWKDLKMNRVLGIYLTLNILLTALFSLTRENVVGSVLWKLCFPYNSPLLILNAAMLFVVFGKMEFRSKTVNRLAGHCFPIYLIHGHPLMITAVQLPLINCIFHYTGDNVFATVLSLFVLAVLIFFGCIAIDCLFSPVWKWIDRQGVKVQERLGY